MGRERRGRREAPGRHGDEHGPGGSDKPSRELLEFLAATGLPDSGLETEPLEALAHDFSSYVVLVAINVVGDQVRDQLNPRLKR